MAKAASAKPMMSGIQPLRRRAWAAPRRGRHNDRRLLLVQPKASVGSAARAALAAGSSAPCR